MTTSSTSARLASSRRRRMAATLAAGLVAGGLGAVAPASAQTSMAGNWTINGNGYTGGLGLQQGPNGELAGTVYNGDTVRGFHSTGSQVAVLLRGAPTRPTQAFVGDVSAGVNEWKGTFYALTVAMGAGPGRNAFGFRAVRGTAAYVYFGEPALGPAAADCLAPSFTVRNRPSEYPAWTFALNLVNPSPPFGCIAGEFSGTIAGDPIYGHYAPGSGSIAFVRLSGGAPAQFYVGRVSGGYVGGIFNPQRIAGSFYALTVGMGAGASRMQYDWTASQ